ncbi:hypothetical protein [Rhizobium leguminosarum]
MSDDYAISQFKLLAADFVKLSSDMKAIAFSKADGWVADAAFLYLVARCTQWARKASVLHFENADLQSKLEAMLLSFKNFETKKSKIIAALARQ